MITLLIATRNAHKTAEIRAILGGRWQLLTLNDYSDAPKVVEDMETFAGNATKKAVELARWLAEKHSTFNIQHSTPKFALADDSGLEMDALNGAPGVHSARFAALDRGVFGLSANTPDADNNAKLLRLLKDIPPERRIARFHCVLALTPVPGESVEVVSPVCYADELEMQTELFDGVCEGRIIVTPRGKSGFGYDPLFVPDGHGQTFAELGDEIKNQLSHRAKALQKLRGYLSRIG